MDPNNRMDNLIEENVNKEPGKFKTVISSLSFRIFILITLMVIIEAGVLCWNLLFSGLFGQVDAVAANSETLMDFSLSDSVRSHIYTAIFASLVIGAIGALLISIYITRAVRNFKKMLDARDVTSPAPLAKTGISDFDHIGRYLESYMSNSADTAAKLSDVLDAAGRPIAVFEMYEKTDRVYVTSHLFSIIEEQDARLYNTGYIPGNVFKAKMSKLDKYIVDEMSTKTSKTFHLDGEGDASKWIRITTLPDETKTLGLVEDISEEMLRRTKMEFERDYDVLTSLLNRRGFHTALQKLFAYPEKLKNAAMFSIDLDNLKKVNDSYGHEYGDEYIRTLANTLSMTCRRNTIISRLGGDEFALFMYGFENEEDLKTEIIRLNIAANNKPFHLPDNTQTQLSASIGVAVYPKDSTSYPQLIKYADFAMYTVKKSTKNGVAEFNLKDYESDAYLTSMSDSIEEFISKRKFEYTFQPIVSARTGELFGYEAFIRSKDETIKNAKHLFELATSRVEMYELENLTWNEAIKSFEELELNSNTKLFINSISDQMLDTKDGNTIKRLYPHLLNQVVVEVKEAGDSNLKFTQGKRDFIGQWGGEVAIGDYGTGNYDEDTLAAIGARYLKIGITITQNLHRDSNRSKLVESLVSFAHQRGMEVIAEGVEKSDDMFALIDIGVDYLQGYRIARPSATPPVKMTIIAAQIQNYNKSKQEKQLENTSK